MLLLFIYNPDRRKDSSDPRVAGSVMSRLSLAAHAATCPETFNYLLQQYIDR